MFFDLNDFTAKIICENEITDAAVETEKRANELEGYREYKTKVKYRLIPFVW